MLVVDTSAVLHALTAKHPDPKLVARLTNGSALHAPHLLEAEVLHALRGLVRGGKLTLDRAHDARADLAGLRLVRYPITGIADRVWELRDTCSAYDACFAALAEALDHPLVTCDAKVAAGGHRANIELYPA